MSIRSRFGGGAKIEIERDTKTMKLNSWKLRLLLLVVAATAGAAWLAWPKLMDSQLWTAFWAWSLALAGNAHVLEGEMLGCFFVSALGVMTIA